VDKDVSNIARSLVFVYRGDNWVLACRVLDNLFSRLACAIECSAPTQIRRAPRVRPPPNLVTF